MTNKLRWSLALLALSLMAAGLYAQAGGPRIVGQGPEGPIDYNVRSAARQPGLIDPATGNSMLGREWEGVASTDYLLYEAYIMSPPNPDIAVGPRHIVTIVNRTIAAYPNPNAVISRRLNAQGQTEPAANSVLFTPMSRTVLTQWIGTVLDYVCPTTPRTNTTCVINHATVRYDQMQGRFLVLFTATDTVARQARWVLVTSRFADLQQGQTSNMTDHGQVSLLNTEVFTTPQPPLSAGGVNANWWIFYHDVDHNMNINDISDYKKLGGTPEGRDCTAAPQNGEAETWCYFPTSARIGLDNDNIILASAVYNDNIPAAARSIANPAMRGTRVRIWKKAAIYQNRSSLPPDTLPMKPGIADHTGNINPAGGQPTQGDYYDVYSEDDGAIGTTVFTVDPRVGEFRGLFYEPAHLRGRALASFSGNASQTGGFTTLVGALNSDTDGNGGPNQGQQTLLYLRSISFTQTIPGTLINTEGENVDVPLIQGGIPRLRARETVPVPAFDNPDPVAQRNTNLRLNVGDNRPHRVIAREGHLYLARVADPQNSIGWRFDNVGMSSTVIYNILQKLGVTTAPRTVMETSWQNGLYFAPMFDVPANVIQYGSVSPINVLPYLEKLFVGTTFPPLAPTDPRPGPGTQGQTGPFLPGIWPLVTGDALTACRGMEPSVSTSVAAFPGLFDIRCGEAYYDTLQLFREPFTGAEIDTIPWGQRGGAGTDPNTLGLWTYGAYAKGRAVQITGPGQWGTYLAYYPLSFPPRDPYNNAIASYNDVPPSHPFFTFIQIAKQTEVQPGSRTALTFNPDGLVLRKDMARWVIRSQMDEAALTAYLNSTGGTSLVSFSDVSANHPDYRYIEAMYRRGYTKGCSGTTDATRKFCPDDNLTRGQMAVFLIRAKMNNVFPTVSSGSAPAVAGCAATGAAPFGDLFGLAAVSWFADSQSHSFCLYISKLAELGISNGKTANVYAPDDPITRGELMVFLVRSFFQ